VTFYKSDNDLPGFSDYSMNNRTYRYFKGQPLYGFGFGLSYTSFRYEAQRIAIMQDSSLLVRTTVTNTGKMDGEEVVQLYVSGEEPNGPIRSLKGFQRIFLKAGQSQVISFNLRPEDLGVADGQGNLKPFKGKVLISVGGRQPDPASIKNKIVVMSVIAR
jgi:beta-glucosidase